MKTTLPAALLLVGLAVGCDRPEHTHAHPAQESAGAQQEIDARPMVELFSWWTAPGEAEALQTLVDAHTLRHSDARMFNAAAASGVRAKEVLLERIERKQPPDMLQDNAHDLRTAVRKDKGRFQQLDGLFDELNLRQTLFPEVLENVSIDGHVYALPVNMHRENGVFYNKRLFAQHQIAPPRTLAEFLAACEALKQKGVTPIATAHQGWILRIMFNTVAMASMGPETYRDLYSGKWKGGPKPMVDAIALFDRILTEYTNLDAAEEGFGWTSAAQAVYNGDAAMFLHGDWAKGYFVQLGWTAGVDFGVLDAPGAGSLFLYGVDVFALPAGGTNSEGAREFLKTVASVPAQAAFNKAKGSSPVRSDVPKDLLDPIGQETLLSLQKAKIRMLVRGQSEFEHALVKFTRDHDRDALLRTFVAHPPHG